MTLDEIARRSGVHKSTASRLMRTLQRHGFVQVQNRHYRLGLGIFSLAHAAAEQLDIREVARPHLESLAHLTRETVHLAVLDDQEVVYIDKIDSQHPLRMYSRIGRRAPCYCTGLGKALLAFLPPGEREKTAAAITYRRFTRNTITDPADLLAHLEQVRRQGYAVDNHEHEDEIHCIAAPIHGLDGRPVAAVSIAAPRSRMPRPELESYVPALLDATRQISAELGHLENGPVAGSERKKVRATRLPRKDLAGGPDGRNDRR